MTNKDRKLLDKIYNMIMDDIVLSSQCTFWTTKKKGVIKHDPNYCFRCSGSRNQPPFYYLG